MINGIQFEKLNELNVDGNDLVLRSNSNLYEKLIILLNDVFGEN